MIRFLVSNVRHVIDFGPFLGLACQYPRVFLKLCFLAVVLLVRMTIGHGTGCLLSQARHGTRQGWLCLQLGIVFLLAWLYAEFALYGHETISPPWALESLAYHRVWLLPWPHLLLCLPYSC